jgi:hypothetical protein
MTRKTARGARGRYRSRELTIKHLINYCSATIKAVIAINWGQFLPVTYNLTALQRRVRRNREAEITEFLCGGKFLIIYLRGLVLLTRFLSTFCQKGVVSRKLHKAVQPVYKNLLSVSAAARPLWFERIFRRRLNASITEWFEFDYKMLRRLLS